MREHPEERTEEVSKIKSTDPAQPALAVEHDGEDAARLLPCPFCGGDASVHYWGNVESECTIMCDTLGCRATVSAKSCGSMTRAYSKARKSWNTRAETRAERDLRDEVNWLHSELHGAEMAASGETVLLENAKLREENVLLRSCLSDDAENARMIMGENAKLREQGARLFDRTLELGTENEKLLELVRDMWRFTGTACKKYPRLFDPAAAGGQTVQLNMIDAFEQRMRELGVEDA